MNYSTKNYARKDCIIILNSVISNNRSKRKPQLWSSHTPILDDIELTDKDKEEKPSDKLTSDYGTVIRESAVLTSFAGFLFGFLLTISISSSGSFIFIDKVILLVALSSITVSISLFIMPIIYHHLEYPYIDLEKFKKRSHRFTIYGLIPAIITLFLGLELAMMSLLGNNAGAFLFGTVPFVLVYIVYRLRK